VTVFCAAKPLLPVTCQIGVVQQHEIHRELLMPLAAEN
jgi:hypothetical protein